MTTTRSAAAPARAPGQRNRADGPDIPGSMASCGTAGLASKNELAGGLQSALSQEEALYRISAYPNPVEGTLSVRLGMPKEGAVKMEIFDISGRLLLSRQEQLELDAAAAKADDEPTLPLIDKASA